MGVSWALAEDRARGRCNCEGAFFFLSVPSLSWETIALHKATQRRISTHTCQDLAMTSLGQSDTKQIELNGGACVFVGIGVHGPDGQRGSVRTPRNIFSTSFRQVFSRKKDT
jgi:hypothetical protein